MSVAEKLHKKPRKGTRNTKMKVVKNVGNESVGDELKTFEKRKNKKRQYTADYDRIRVNQIKEQIKKRILKPTTKKLYDNAYDVQLMVDDYFNNAVGTQTITTNKGKEITYKPYTISGLCRWIGYAGTKDFYEDRNHPVFGNVLKNAHNRIIEHYETTLQGATAPTGAIFALKNIGNWRDRQDVEVNQTVREIKVSVGAGETADEINKL